MLRRPCSQLSERAAYEDAEQLPVEGWLRDRQPRQVLCGIRRTGQNPMLVNHGSLRRPAHARQSAGEQGRQGDWSRWVARQATRHQQRASAAALTKVRLGDRKQTRRSTLWPIRHGSSTQRATVAVKWDPLTTSRAGDRSKVRASSIPGAARLSVTQCNGEPAETAPPPGERV